MGSVVMVDLRLLGLAVPSQSVSEMIGRLMPWTWWALSLNLVTGLLFVVARPGRYFFNPVFGIKFALLVPAVVLAFVIHRLSIRKPGYWERSPVRLVSARVIAVVSLALWVGVVLSGRWIAYSDYLFLLRVRNALMPFTEFWDWIQDHPLSQYIGFSYWFPLLESIHVLAISLVVGSIVWVDLRLLGVAGLTYPASRMTRELIPWTWAAFCVAAVTGTGLFMTRAGAYLENPAFQIKLGCCYWPAQT